MEEANCMVPVVMLNEESESANDAWKKCTSEMVNIICNNIRPAVDKDFNSVLLENRDLRKQYKMAIAALDSIISEKDVVEEDCTKTVRDENVPVKNVNISEGVKEKRTSETGVLIQWGKTPEFSHTNQSRVEEFSSPKNKSKVFDHDCRSNKNFKTLQKKFNDYSCGESQEQSLSSAEDEHRKRLLTSSKVNIKKSEEFICSRCSKEPKDNVNVASNRSITKDVQILVQDCYKLKKDLEQARESNNTLTNELISKMDENEQLRDQVQSLELSWKTLTEAINLQDEQLSEYGSVVTTLKNSRSHILEKMKDANARNAHNIFIMENIEKQVAQLKSQLDAYSELLSNQNAELIDKASSTEQTFVDQNSFDELMKKKDYYITLLQDRLCEAIVDLKNKDSEIKNHTTSVKSLIQNYEGEKKCLEERLKFANLSVEKMEEHKIKQQETMKQLMKLIEFLQDKLEINKK